MEKALFLYSTREGQTKKILQKIANQLRDIECDFFNLHDMPNLDFFLYEKVIIGASIRYGRFNKRLYQFIKINSEELIQSNAAFICINLTARKESEEKDTPKGCVYIKTFLKKSLWQPKLIGVFAGALRYPHYHWFDKFMIKFIMKMTKGETDTSKEIEYTNWIKVEDFGEKFKNM